MCCVVVLFSSGEGGEHGREKSRLHPRHRGRQGSEVRAGLYRRALGLLYLLRWSCRSQAEILCFGRWVCLDGCTGIRLPKIELRARSCWVQGGVSCLTAAANSTCTLCDPLSLENEVSRDSKRGGRVVPLPPLPLLRSAFVEVCPGTHHSKWVRTKVPHLQKNRLASLAAMEKLTMIGAKWSPSVVRVCVLENAAHEGGRVHVPYVCPAFDRMGVR